MTEVLSPCSGCLQEMLDAQVARRAQIEEYQRELAATDSAMKAAPSAELVETPDVVLEHRVEAVAVEVVTPIEVPAPAAEPEPEAKPAKAPKATKKAAAPAPEPIVVPDEGEHAEDA